VNDYTDNPNSAKTVVSPVTPGTTNQNIAGSNELTYMDDNSVQSDMVTNPADSRAKNRNEIAYRTSGDASENTPMFFSGDPIIEANLRSHAAQQQMLVDRMKSSRQSGDMNEAESDTGDGFISKDSRQEQ